LSCHAGGDGYGDDEEEEEEGDDGGLRTRERLDFF